MKIRSIGLVIISFVVIVFLFTGEMIAQVDSIATDTSFARKPESSFVILDSNLLVTDSNFVVNETKQKTNAVSLGIDSTNIYYFTGSLDSLKSGNLRTIDTSTLFITQFDPLYKYNGIYSTLSNIGLANKNLVFSPITEVGYDMQINSFRKYLYNNNQVKYYRQYIPYTEIEYILGSKKEQNFKIIFSRELWKRFIFGVDFALNNSPGPYQNSKGDDKRVFFTAQWYTKNKRYGVVANYLSNKIVVGENGGIIYDTVFEDNLESDRRIIPINLANAENIVKHTGFFVEQYFNLLKPVADTAPRKVDAGNISYSFHYERNKIMYSDGAYNPFYQPNAAPLDSLRTFDSVFQQRVRNRIRWSSIGYHDDPKSQLFHIFAGINYDYIWQTLPTYPDTSIQLQNLKTSFSQLTAFGGFAVNISKIFRLNTYVEYMIGEYNKNDLKLVARLDQLLGSKNRNIGSLHFGLDLINRSPSWYFQKYNSNYYRWENDLKKESILILFGEYRYKQLRAGVNFQTLGDYTYFDDSIRPQQLDKAATVLQIYAQGTIPLKKFGINTRLVYQTTSHPDVLRLPSFSGTLNIYFKSPVFKRAATLQIGFQFNYFSSFKADAYMPALRDFYIQNETTIGNYLYADVYVTLQIKTVRIFFKYAHFNSLFGNYTYYLAPHYPARDARFYLGINWRFHD